MARSEDERESQWLESLVGQPTVCDGDVAVRIEVDLKLEFEVLVHGALRLQASTAKLHSITEGRNVLVEDAPIRLNTAADVEFEAAIR